MFQVHKKLSSHFSKKICVFVQKWRKSRSDKKPRRNWVLEKSHFHKKLSTRFRSLVSYKKHVYSLFYILYVTRIFNFKSICSMRSPFHISTHKQTKIIIKPRKFLYPGSLYTCQAKKIEGNEFLMGHGINTIDISIIIFKIICTVSSCTTSRIRISNIMCRSYFFW